MCVCVHWQVTLFRWLSACENERYLVTAEKLPRGAPKQYKLTFGAYKGYSLSQLVNLSLKRNEGGEQTRQRLQAG